MKLIAPTINIKIIDSQGSEKTVFIEDNGNLQLAPGDHAYLSPQYMFDTEGNFTNKPLLLTEDNYTNYLYPDLEYTQNIIGSNQTIPLTQIKVITLAQDTTTSNDRLDNNDTIATDLKYANIDDTTASYGPILSFSTNNSGTLGTEPVTTTSINQTTSDTSSLTAPRSLSDNEDTVSSQTQIFVPVSNDNQANNTINSAPILTVPSAQAGNENNAIVISGINISDVDIANGELTTSLSITNGSITLNNITGLSFYSGANGTANMTFAGTLTNINNAITNLTYLGNTDFNGNDTLNISVDDQGNTGSGGALLDSDSIAITVNPVNDAPALAVPGAQAVDEESALVINGTSISDVDVSGSDLEVILSVSDGTITLASTGRVKLFCRRRWHCQYDVHWHAR